MRINLRKIGRWHKNICWYFSEPNRVIATFTVVLALFGGFALWIARDTEKRQLRAYVYEVPVLDKFTAGEKLAVGILIKNGGQTPAYDFSVAINAQISDYPQKESLVGVGLKPAKVLPHGEGLGDFVYQEHTMTLLFANAPIVTPEQYQAVLKGISSRLYVWGRIEYSDAFKERHYTNFCSVIGGESTLKGQASYCSNGNDAN